jgi:hypothetical protein
MFVVAAPCLAASPYITAAINWPGGKAQFFLSDGTYVRYDIGADSADPGYPKPVTDRTWPGMGNYGRQIVAAANMPNNKACFFLSDGRYIQYDIGQDRVDAGYPRTVTDRNWPGLAPYATRLFGALNWNNGKIQFFLNNHSYIRYDVNTQRVDEGYPKPITQATWPGLARYAEHLAGAINWTNGKAYIFFDDGRYVRYDISADRVDAGYPKPIDSRTWPGLDMFFRR